MNEEHELNVDRRNVLLGAGKAAAAGVVATLGAGAATTAQRRRHSRSGMHDHHVPELARRAL